MGPSQCYEVSGCAFYQGPRPSGGAQAVYSSGVCPTKAHTCQPQPPPPSFPHRSNPPRPTQKAINPLSPSRPHLGRTTARAVFSVALPMAGQGLCERHQITVSTNNGLHVCMGWHTTYFYREGEIFAQEIFRTRKFRTGFVSHSGLNPVGNFAPFQDCIVYYWAVLALHCQIPLGFRIVLRNSRSFHDCILHFQGVPA